MWDIAFPGTVMVLKLFFKVCVEQQVKYLDVAKAVLAFPIDIAFLSLSFGAALLYSRPPSVLQDHTIRSMFIALFLTLVLVLLITVLAKKSDAAYNRARYFWTFGFFFVAYVLAAVTVWGALNVGALL